MPGRNQKVAGVLRQVRDRNNYFKKFGYDVNASRKDFMRFAGPLSGKILEVGTGRGNLLVRIASTGAKPVSIDADPKILRFAKFHLAALKLQRSVRLKKMNAERLQFPAQSFDMLVSMDFFHHAAAPVKCLKEMIRVTRSRIVISDFNKKGIQLMHRIHRAEGHGHPLSKISFAQIKKMLLKNGFSVKLINKDCHTFVVAIKKHTRFQNSEERTRNEKK